MGIDIWEVIEAAKTKPFGYMPFYPGPGLGGHCIPIDPFYLTWRAKQFGQKTRFIELAGEINTAMPGLVVKILEEELKKRFDKHLVEAAILVLGIAYKKNIDLFHITHHDVFPVIYFRKTIVSVMDIFLIDYKNDSSSLFKLLYYLVSFIALNRAKKIITISKATKNSIVKKLNLIPNKVHDILIACDKEYKHTSNEFGKGE